MNSAPDPVKEKRDAVAFATRRGLAQRRGCALVALSRSTARYQARGRDDKQLLQSIQAIQAVQPRFGVRRIHVRLLQNGQPLNHKRVQRVMHVYNLQVVRRRSKRTIRTGASVPQKAQHPNDVWTIDFQEDALIGGRKVRILNLLDEFTREWLSVIVGTSATATTVRETLLTLFRERGAPKFLRSDNGGEFIAERLASLLTQANVTSFFIEPGCPWQNGYIESFHSESFHSESFHSESFHSRLRDELLSREAFLTAQEAQVRLDAHRVWYNQDRPHSALAYLTPVAFRLKWERNEQT